MEIKFRFILLSILLFSCSEKPIFDNPYDPDSGYQTAQMQGELIITQLNDSQIKLEWQLNSTIMGNYKIKRKINSGNYEDLATVGKDTNTFTDTGLLITNTYHYQIIGANDEVQTQPIANTITTTFAEITNFNIQQENLFTAKLTWQHACDYEEGYIIERMETGKGERENWKKVERKKEKGKREKTDDFVLIDTLVANTLSYIDVGSEPNHFYEYRIKAFSQYNESNYKTSEYSNVIVAPTNLIITQDNVHTFSLIWIDNSIGEQGFKIERKIDNSDFILIHTSAENDTTYIDDINTRNTYNTVYYRIYTYYIDEISSILYGSFVIEFVPIYNLEYEKLEIDKIKLTWDDENEGEDGFVIEKRINQGNWELQNTVTENEWTDENAEINQDIQYRVQVFSGDNCTDFILTDDYYNVIPAPTNLIITQNNVHTFSFVWNDNSNGEQGFKIERKIDNGDYILIHTNAENDTTYTDDMNTRNTYETVYYKIIALYEGFYSDSLESNCTIGFPAPSNLNCIPIDIDQIALEWIDNSIGEDGFIIEQKENTGVFIEITTTSQSNYITSNLDFNSDYTFRVKAFSGNNFSDYSNEFSINIKEAISPANLLGNISLVNNIEIHWTNNCTFETGFKIQRKKGVDVYQTIHINNVNDTTYIDTTAEPLTRYFYRVASVCVYNQSEWSNEIDFLTYLGNIFVDCNGTGNYLTIQEGIDSASNGDIIIVKEGMYYENIDFNGKNITLASLFLTTQITNYISQTIIDGNQYGSVVKFENGEDTTAILCGFTITNGQGGGTYPNYTGGGITCIGSSPSLEYLIIKDNSASHGGGIYCDNYSSPNLSKVKITSNSASYGGGIQCNHYSSPNLENVIISYNRSTGYHNNGGGIYCYQSSPSLVSVTIYGNSTTNCVDGGNGGGIYCNRNSQPFLTNCILWNASPEEIYFCQYSDPNSITILYSDIQGGESGIVTNGNGTVNWLTGCINENPLFIGSGDFHLQPCSPCIDAGNPNSQYNDPDGTRNDMGAYGGPGGEW